MPTYSSRMAANASIQSAQAGQVTVQRGTYDLSAAQLADNTAEVRIVRLPAEHRIVRGVFETEDLDTGATGTVDIGLVDTIQDPSDTTNLTLFATGLSIQAASINLYETAALKELAAVPYDRYVVVQINVAAGTPAPGQIAFELTSRPDHPTHEGNFD